MALQQPFINQTSLKREYEYSLKESSDKLEFDGLIDIDEAIQYYFQNVIKPEVTQNGNLTKVPVLYGTPERWASVQAGGFHRDKNNKNLIPLIMFKRENITYNRDLGNKLDGNKVNNVSVIKRKFSRRNVYDNFYILSNQQPQYEYILSVIPDYVTIEYSCIIYTNTIENNNQILESMIFASNAYWGDPKKYIFKALCDSYTLERETPIDNDTFAKTTFTITLNGYIISDSINRELAMMSNKYYNITKVIFTTERSVV